MVLSVRHLFFLLLSQADQDGTFSGLKFSGERADLFPGCISMIHGWASFSSFLFPSLFGSRMSTSLSFSARLHRQPRMPRHHCTE